MGDGGWIGVASIAVTGLLGLAQLVVKTRYDDKIKTLTTQNEAQEEKIATLTTSQAKCERESEECKREHQQTKDVLERVRIESAARDRQDKADLQAQIDELKAKIAPNPGEK